MATIPKCLLTFLLPKTKSLMKSRGHNLAVIGLLLCFASCSDSSQKAIPASIKIDGDIVEFQLKDREYKKVQLGSNITGNWSMAAMDKIDSVWVYSTWNPRRTIEYKFLVNGNIWMLDPENPNKKKVPQPFEGYNSVLVLK
jgi:hypothetical protein